ncbi:alpha/beta hydrolase [Mucilaginibacter sp. BT774]|uniref:alpha/beta hydrolase n=1 Tax=Mucilaginibacter sp. BT774 TaxID=3062276 RepID=UPI00267465D0|nr:alpha/beta hydrolase-fold protein [Mucilaginibacter sp. BT774]MDO3624597.1 alpha/beta hydrolase-fold protein [Mucilaginibacter sp. BT774]
MALAIFLAVILIMILVSARTLKRKPVFICKGDCIFSEILNEKRDIWIYLPKTEDDPELNKHQYPVVYLFDAEEQYAGFRELMQCENADGRKVFRDTIIVGIRNTNRSRDLTPTHSVIDSKGKKTRGFKPSGGGDKFIAFIQEELFPYIEAKYPVSSERILMGHSLGGLTTINILLHHPEMFTGYIASDPSMWWDDKFMLNEAREILSKEKFDGKWLYFSIANATPPFNEIEHIHNDTSAKTNHVRSIFELGDILQQNPGNGLHFSYKFYDQDSHDSVAMKTAYDGMQLLEKLPVN